MFGAAFWIGAVVGRDTLVSEGADGWDRNGNEFNPDPSSSTKSQKQMSHIEFTNKKNGEFEGIWKFADGSIPRWRIFLFAKFCSIIPSLLPISMTKGSGDVI